MDTPARPARHLEDLVVFYAFAGGWAAYAVGALYALGPAVAVALMALLALRTYAAPILPAERRPQPPPFGVWLWIIGMLVMLAALLVGHAAQDLGIPLAVKSTIGWVKGWALLAIFPLAGACLNIKEETIYRASGWFAVWTLILLPVFAIAPYAGLPEKLFVSPLKVIGGPGPEVFTFQLYTVDPESGLPRWQFTAPWSPAAGLVANVMFICAMEERSRLWKVVGAVAAIVIVMMCQSRMALLSLIMIWPAAFAVGRIVRPTTWLAGAASALAAALAAPVLIAAVQNFIDAFTSARAGSSRVRAALGRIAVDRWRTEAPVFGHGVVEPGPHYVEYMPIGSHHSWFGLLFVKGLTGFLALLIPLAWTLLEMALLAPRHPLGRAGLACALLMVFFSFGENLEMLAYLYWPALILIGIAFKQGRIMSAEAEQASAA